MHASISICIPAYNRAALLPALLDSIFSQKYEIFEVLIIEDKSPEREQIAQIAEQYSAKYPGKITYKENKRNLGYDGNLRCLIESASGDYVLFMGNDDLLALGALEFVSKSLEKCPDTAVILRSYTSFHIDPIEVAQTFRYFDSDRYFPPGVDTVVTFFRRSVFISGMVFNRIAAAACATEKFDGTLLYQQYLVCKLLMESGGLYLWNIVSHHRLGGIPDFGCSASESSKYVPGEQTAESSVEFMRGMLYIAAEFEQSYRRGVYFRILRDIGNYSYPVLSIQSKRSMKEYIWYVGRLGALGLWRVPLFHLYAVALLILGRTICDHIIASFKGYLGRAPRLGRVYDGRPPPERPHGLDHS